MTTLETTQKVPLTLWKDGTIRVKGTRLLIDMIVGAHNRGESPEEIFKSFPSDVYTVCASGNADWRCHCGTRNHHKLQ